MKHIALIVCAGLLFLAGPASAESHKGYLTVHSAPAKVSVFVDGKYMGPAADRFRVRKFALTPGPHTVRLASDGYTESTQHIYVTPGHTSDLPIALSPEAKTSAGM